MMLLKTSFLLVATLLVNSDALTPQNRAFSLNLGVGSMSAGFSLGSKGAANSSASSSGSSSTTASTSTASSSSAASASQVSNLSSTVSNSTSNCSSSDFLLEAKAKAALAVLTSQISQVSAIFGEGLASAQAQGEGAAGIAQYFERLQNSTKDVLSGLSGIGAGAGNGTGNSTTNSTSSAGSPSNSTTTPITSIIQGLENAGGGLVSIVKLALDIKKQIISGALEMAGKAAGAAGTGAEAGLNSLAKLVSAGSDSVGGGLGQNGLENAALAGFAAKGASFAQVAAGIATGLVAGFGIAI